jgi:hypothetical protein
LRFRVYNSGLVIQDLGFRVPGFRVQGLGFRVQGSGFRVQGSGFMEYDSGYRVTGFRVQGLRGPAATADSITDTATAFTRLPASRSALEVGCLGLGVYGLKSWV